MYARSNYILIVGGILMGGVYENFTFKPSAYTRRDQPIGKDVTDDAYSNLDALLSGPLTGAANDFGVPLLINDALSGVGTKRKVTSQHNHGKAVDISTRGMSNAQKMKLLGALQRHGFNGFGFNDSGNFLHADLRDSRMTWSYNSQPKWAGKDIKELKLQNMRRLNPSKSITPTSREYE